MKRGVADGSEVDENNVAVRLLQGHGSIDCGSGAARAALGAEESKYAGLARAPEIAGAGRTEASERFGQSLWATGMVDILAGAGAHAGDNVGGPRHFAVGEDADLLGGGANQFDGMDGALGVLRGNVDDHYFGARILELAENRIGRSSGKADMAEHRLA